MYTYTQTPTHTCTANMSLSMERMQENHFARLPEELKELVYKQYFTNHVLNVLVAQVIFAKRPNRFGYLKYMMENDEECYVDPEDDTNIQWFPSVTHPDQRADFQYILEERRTQDYSSFVHVGPGEYMFCREDDIVYDPETHWDYNIVYDVRYAPDRNMYPYVFEM